MVAGFQDEIDSADDLVYTLNVDAFQAHKSDSSDEEIPRVASSKLPKVRSFEKMESLKESDSDGGKQYWINFHVLKYLYLVSSNTSMWWGNFSSIGDHLYLGVL